MALSLSLSSNDEDAGAVEGRETGRQENLFPTFVGDLPCLISGEVH